MRESDSWRKSAAREYEQWFATLPREERRRLAAEGLAKFEPSPSDQSLRINEEDGASGEFLLDEALTVAGLWQHYPKGIESFNEAWFAQVDPIGADGREDDVWVDCAEAVRWIVRKLGGEGHTRVAALALAVASGWGILEGFNREKAVARSGVRAREFEKLVEEWRGLLALDKGEVIRVVHLCLDELMSLGNLRVAVCALEIVVGGWMVNDDIQSEVARSHGLSRQTISKACARWRGRFGFPREWANGKSEESVLAFQKAQRANHWRRRCLREVREEMLEG